MELKDKRPKVAVFLESAYLTNRELLTGFLKCTRLHGLWTPVLRTGRDDEPTQRSANLAECAGIITDRLDASIARIARTHRIPVITVLCNRRTPEVIANVTCDDDSVARLASDHLLARGFRSFAYVGGTTKWSRVRGHAFRRAIAAHKFKCPIYSPDGQPLADFLAGLPHPVGVFAANDVLAQPVLTAARSAGLSVPDDVAVIGVDDDEILCASSDPALTSIKWNTEDVGYALGELLREALTARVLPHFREIRYVGLNVLGRASTARRVESDELVLRCLMLMEANSLRLLSISDLAEKLAVSRRTLERRFRIATGDSLGHAITETKLERAESFLRTTSLSQDAIASECGLYDASHMNAVFRRRRGTLPSSYR